MRWNKRNSRTRRPSGGIGVRLLYKLLFAFLVGAVLGLVFLTGGRPQPKAIPADERHRACLEALARGDVRLQVEKLCLACHGSQGTVLSPGHPPKEQCLLCHPAG